MILSIELFMSCWHHFPRTILIITDTPTIIFWTLSFLDDGKKQHDTSQHYSFEEERKDQLSERNSSIDNIIDILQMSLIVHHWKDLIVIVKSTDGDFKWIIQLKVFFFKRKGEREKKRRRATHLHLNLCWHIERKTKD